MNIMEDEVCFTTRTIYRKSEGTPVLRQVWMGGKLHAPPDGKPSETFFDEQGRVTKMVWHLEGREHRINGPAKIFIDPETGVHVLECYRHHGQEPTSTETPIWTERDAASGKVIYERYAALRDGMPKLTG